MGEIRVKTADGWQVLPSHEKTSTGWKDIPTHIMADTGWQGELTSQSPLEFRATGQSLLDWRIDGASGGVGVRTENYLPSPGAETKSQSGVTIACDGKGGYTIQREGGYSGAVTLLFDIPETTIPNNSNAKLSIFNSDSAGISIEFYYNDTRIDYWSLTSSNRVAAIGSFANKTINKVGFNVASTSQLLPITTTPQITDAVKETYIPYGYKIPVTVGGVTTNLYTTAQLMDGDSLDYTTDQTAIPITQGDNTLTVDTAVQPSKVFVKFEG